MFEGVVRTKKNLYEVMFDEQLRMLVAFKNDAPAYCDEVSVDEVNLTLDGKKIKYEDKYQNASVEYSEGVFNVVRMGEVLYSTEEPQVEL